MSSAFSRQTKKSPKKDLSRENLDFMKTYHPLLCLVGLKQTEVPRSSEGGRSCWLENPEAVISHKKRVTVLNFCLCHPLSLPICLVGCVTCSTPLRLFERAYQIFIVCVWLERYCVNLVLNTGFLLVSRPQAFSKKIGWLLGVFYFSIFFFF